MSLTILSDKKTLTPEEYSFYYGHLRNARRPRIRSMLEFAEQEIVLPNGPYEGRRYRWEWQPYGRLYFEAVDSGLWNRFNATGPTQTGKTLHCFATPTLFHLFEVGETVICGVADEDMAADKWRDDLLPVIERTRYRELLPRHGAGARGGKIKDAIQFRHGPVLKFMTGGGGDKSRAAFTARVLVVTETDGLDTSDTTSREADKVRQLEARTRAYDDAKRVYLECTVSIPEGRTWQEYTAGTKSKIVLPCPRCRAWVTPEREHLQGWQDAESEIEARELAHFCCPDCGQHWTEEERREANLRGQLLHRGQEIDEKGKIAGPLPQTQTLGFRWSHVNNFFSSAGNAGAEEWRKPRAVDEENAEKELCQFTWALPYKGPVEEEAHLDPHLLAERTVDLPKGIVPAGTEFLTMGLDLGKWQAHWILVAWKAGALGHIVDYGVLEIMTDELGLEGALLAALREFRDSAVNEGWPDRGDNDNRRVPDQIWVDAGYRPDVVYPFCLESQGPSMRWRPAIGRGQSQQRQQRYTRPKTTGAVIVHLGEDYHIVRLKQDAVFLVEVNSDKWKTWVHRRLAAPIDAPGAMTLYSAQRSQHLALARQLTAEKEEKEFVAGQGEVVRWVKVRQANHWLDGLYNAAAAAHLKGVRLLDAGPARAAKPAPQQPKLTTPDGRPFLLTERED